MNILYKSIFLAYQFFIIIYLYFFQIGRERDVDPMLQQQILDQLRRDNENAMESLVKQKALAMQATKVRSIQC
jgi:uncharacterized membrane protein YbaN (DUF454 family)